MGWNDDYPYTFKSNETAKSPSGSTVDIYLQVLSKLDCELRYSEMPWARALVELREGRIDMLAFAFIRDERQEFAHYSSVKFYSPNILFMRTEDIAKYPLDVLRDVMHHKLRIGTQLQVSYGRDFDELMTDKNFAFLVETNSDRKALWRMLQLGRIDGVVADQRTGLAELKQMQLNQAIGITEVTISSEASYFIFSKQTTDSEFVQAFDLELTKLQQSGALDKIFERYE
jgi:polar amino acid transport system substrate-binding protein